MAAQGRAPSTTAARAICTQARPAPGRVTLTEPSSCSTRQRSVRRWGSPRETSRAPTTSEGLSPTSRGSTASTSPSASRSRRPGTTRTGPSSRFAPSSASDGRPDSSGRQAMAAIRASFGRTSAGGRGSRRPSRRTISIPAAPTGQTPETSPSAVKAASAAGEGSGERDTKALVPHPGPADDRDERSSSFVLRPSFPVAPRTCRTSRTRRTSSPRLARCGVDRYRFGPREVDHDGSREGDRSGAAGRRGGPPRGGGTGRGTACVDGRGSVGPLQGLGSAGFPGRNAGRVHGDAVRSGVEHGQRRPVRGRRGRRRRAAADEPRRSRPRPALAAGRLGDPLPFGERRDGTPQVHRLPLDGGIRRR